MRRLLFAGLLPTEGAGKMKPKEEMSNYEKCCEQWRIKFLELD